MSNLQTSPKRKITTQTNCLRKTYNLLKPCLYTCFASIFLLSAIILGAETLPVAPDEAEAWLDYTLPLPQKINISAKQIVKPAELRIEISSDADEITRNAAELLKTYIRERTDCEMPADPGFKVLPGVLNAQNKINGMAVEGAEVLRKLPNNDQAYLIRPHGENMLIIAALDSKGAYYGMLTLRQLLARSIGPGAIEIPLAYIEDWPDFGNRGFWNGPPEMYLAMSELKMNYIKNFYSGTLLAVRPPPDADGRLKAPTIYRADRLETSRAIYKDAKLYAFYAVPAMMHLNCWARLDFWPELLKMYPGLAGQGETAYEGGLSLPGFRAPCTSHPMFQQIIADTLTHYAGKGIMEVSVWTTEYFSYCSCSKCIPPGGMPRQFVLETEKILAAYQEVKKNYPEFRLRVFGFPLESTIRSSFAAQVCEELHQTTPMSWEREAPEILKAIPNDVIIEAVYVHKKWAASGYLHDGTHKVVNFDSRTGMAPFVNTIPLIFNFLKSIHSENWYGTVAHFASLGGEPEQALRMSAHGIAAQAEWSWNLKGRRIEDFIRAWVTINGIRPIKEAAKWTELAVARDLRSVNIWDFTSADIEFMRNIITKVRAGDPLPDTLCLNDVIDARTEIEQDLRQMEKLAAVIDNDDLKLRSAHLQNSYQAMFTLYDFTRLYNTKAAKAEICGKAKELRRITDDRSKSYENLLNYYRSLSTTGKKTPYYYIKLSQRIGNRWPDFTGQLLLLDQELIPLFE